MADKNLYELFTAEEGEYLVASRLEKRSYSAEVYAAILKEAEDHVLKYERRAMSWYESEESCSTWTKEIEAEAIIVKNSRFYGALVDYDHSYWSYRSMDEVKGLTALTLDRPSTTVSDYDHSTQNGDSYDITKAYLVKKEA